MLGMTDRRHFMKHVAGTTAFGLVANEFLGNIVQAAGPVAGTKRKFKSLIFIYFGGGATMQDFFDLKPGHANNGESKTMKTAASGVEINELLPTIASQMKNVALVRSLRKNEGDHMRGTYLSTTGVQLNPLSVRPSLPALYSYLQREHDGELPSFISIGNGNGSIGPGFLGSKYDRFVVQNPGTPPENIRPPQDVAGRMDRRSDLFKKLEGGFQTSTKGEKDAAKMHQELYDKAFSLVVSKNKDIFTFTSEDTKTLTDYGTTGFARSCLMARKLVEAGAAAVTLDVGGWDNHQNIFTTFRTKLPEVDKGIGALLKDLAQRGLLQDVVVMTSTEFARTPRINANAGRDHWPATNSLMLAGGKIVGGQAYGATDAGCESIKENPVTMPDIFATVYAALGLEKPEEQQVRDNLGRPSAISGDAKGKVIKELVKGS